MEFVSQIEKRASEAPQYEAFNRASLHGIKDAVAKLLELIGRDGVFREYTRHDISHINRLLEMLDWIVPPTTLSRLSVADCLMTTLAVYFHDLGMLVTRDEFDRRGESGFPEFKEKVLFAGPEGKDYENKVRKLPPEEAERFLYQEFVRTNHAERVRAWIVGKTATHLGVAARVVEELNTLLNAFDEKFRKDLGLVCESHHRQDLDNLEKYKCSQPYGASSQETANLQYCSILLRTADLLHVTRDRTPSISFRLINPTDPKSVEEWHKQMAVVTVRPKPGLDKDGNIDPAAVMDTVEVHGYFTEPEGFFALTSYLNYARTELRRSRECVETARKKKGSTYEFPWREIDDSNCEAAGFIEKQFEFTLDQARILDLLTGHTLYNDTTVVLRELVQNSLDAIRLQWEEFQGDISAGEVTIAWDSAERVITIVDNGTGMTQDVVDRHFLTVGSSLYQDDQFKKRHPHFSSISRFGIGVLSTFMVSDEIEVTTSHPDDDRARVLSLRSLHGKYLIRLLEKDSQDLPPHIRSHGTQIKLKVRSSAELGDLRGVLQRWILFPRCRVSVVIDGSPPVSIGFSEPREAVRQELIDRGWLNQAGPSTPAKDGEIKVEQRSRNGVTLAYALRWSAFFREWSFVELYEQGAGQSSLIGSCIEGVRVEFGSPGYDGWFLIAISNSVGPAAPKTNVARSGIEDTPERRSLIRTVYDLYCEHVKDEFRALQAERSFSLTWPLEESAYLLGRLVATKGESVDAIDDGLLSLAFRDVPSIPLEVNGARIGVSPSELSEASCFWTVDSAFFSSAEALVKEVSAPVSISTLAQSLGSALSLPEGPFTSVAYDAVGARGMAFQGREVDRIVVHREQRRVDLRWTNVGEERTWVSADPDAGKARQFVRGVCETGARHLRNQGGRDIYIAERHLQCDGLAGEVAIRSMRSTFVLPASEYARYLLRLLAEINSGAGTVVVGRYAIALRALSIEGSISDPLEFVRREKVRIERETPFGINDVEPDAELLDVLGATAFRVFDPRDWTRIR